MNILIISQYFWPENFKINDVAKGLIARGHNVSVLTGLPNYPKGKFFDGYSFPKNKKEIMKGLLYIDLLLFLEVMDLQLGCF